MKKLSSVFGGLSGKIQMVFFIIFFFAAIILAVLVYVTLKPDMVRRYERHLTMTTDLVANLTKMHIRTTVRNHLNGLALNMYKYAEYEYSRYLRGEISESRAYHNFKRLMLDSKLGKVGETGYMAGISGSGRAAIHPRLPGRDLSKYDSVQDAIKMKNGYLEYDWKNPGDEKKRKKAGGLLYFKPWNMLIWASSYRDEFIKFIDKKDIMGIMDSVTIGESGYAVFINSSGKLVRDDENTYTASDKPIVKDREYVQSMIDQARADPGKSHVRYIPDGFKKKDKGIPHIAVYRYIPDLDWVLVSLVSETESVKAVNTVFYIVGFILIIGVIAIFIITSIVFSRIIRPVSQVKELSDAVSAGDLTKRADVQSNDEIGQMSLQFNVIIDNFSSLLKDISETSAMLQESVQELSASSQEIATTSNQQSAAVREIVSTMEDSDKLSKSIATKIGEVTRISEDTRQIVDNGFSIIKDSLSKMDEIMNANADTIQGIKLLGEKIDSIWDIVNIINGIADQTKIIAFNAELEASAAGEAGKNFQIVATEIRRLADNTVSSTNEIRSKINEIQHSSDRLIITSEEGTGKIKQGLDLSNGLRKQFDDILRSSEISVSSAEQISVSIKQQVSAFEQILLTLKQISEGIDNFVVSTSSMTNFTESLKNKSTHLNSVVSYYRTTEDEGDANE